MDLECLYKLCYTLNNIDTTLEEPR